MLTFTAIEELWPQAAGQDADFRNLNREGVLQMIVRNSFLESLVPQCYC
jgi:hypothetical protein